MKKWAMILAALLLLSSLAGCKDTVDPAEDKSGESTSASTEKAAESDKETEKSSQGETEKESESSSAARVITAEDYSGRLTDEGYVKDLRALDYVELPDWRTVVIERSKVEPSSSEVQSALENILQYFPEEITDRAVADGDLVNIDYEGKLDGVAFAGGAAKGADLTAGSEQFVDNFLTKIIGHMPGETFDLEITFPDPYQNNPDLAGKLTIFTVTINYISGTPEYTDEFVQKNADAISQLTGFEKADTTDDLTERFRNYLYESKLKSEIYAYFDGMAFDEIPPEIYKYVYDMTDISIYKNYQTSLETMASAAGLTADQLREEINASCKPELVFQAIAETEGYTFTDEEILEVLQASALDTFISRYGRGYLARYAMTERALKYIEKLVNVTDEEVVAGSPE